MIDERQEELAALYALDLLEGAERAQFETALARDPALQKLVDELRESSSALAHGAPAAVPPAELKQRVLASIGHRAPEAVPDNVIRPAAFRARTFVPWAIAAGFALATVWSSLRYIASRNENAALRAQQEVASTALQIAQTTLESERLVSQRQLATISDTNRQLADATQRIETFSAERRTLDQQLAAARSELASRERALAAAESRAADWTRQLATLTQRVETLSRASEETGRQLAAAQQAADQLDNQLRSQASVADMKIATLVSMLKKSPEAVAVAVWDPKKQEGVATFEKLPALAASQSFELWVIEGSEGAKPVSAGVFTANPDGGGRLEFKPTAPVATIATFAISREKKDGAKAHATPGEVIMLGKGR